MVLQKEEVRRLPVSGEYQSPDPFSSASFQSLKDFVLERVSSAGRDVQGDFEQFERDLRDRFMAFEADVVAAHLSRYDEKAPEIEVNGVVYRYKDDFEKKYCALGGTFVLKRSLYVPRGGGKGLCPLELRAGMVEGYWTPGAARVAARAVSASTPREATDLFRDLGGMQPSESSLDRLPKLLSEHWEEHREVFEEELRSQETIPREAVAVGVSLDGVLVPMKNDKPQDASEEERAAAPAPTSATEPPSASDQRPQGPEGYREVGCGTVTFYDAQGDRLETIRYARSPEYKKGTLKSELEAELRSIFKSRPDLDLVELSDGAEDNWEFLDSLAGTLELRPEKVKHALDIFHALERVKKALDAYHGEGTSAAKAAFEECRIWLREEKDGTDRVLRALRHRRNNSRGAKRKTITIQIKYLAKRKSLTRYKELLDANLPIGSGIVEAACKTLATERLKRSGMRWSEEGSQGILTLRSLIQSGRWDAGWAFLASQYKAYVIPRARAA